MGITKRKRKFSLEKEHPILFATMGALKTYKAKVFLF